MTTKASTNRSKSKTVLPPKVPGFVPSISASGPPQGKMVGVEAQVYYAVAGGTSAIFANVVDFALEIQADEVDLSDRATQGWKDKRTGLKEWSGSIKANAIQNGVDVNTFFDAISGGITLTGSFRPQDVTGGLAYTGSFVIKNYKYNGAASGAQTFDMTISGRGPLVRGTVTAGGA